MHILGLQSLYFDHTIGIAMNASRTEALAKAAPALGSAVLSMLNLGLFAPAGVAAEDIKMWTVQTVSGEAEMTTDLYLA